MMKRETVGLLFCMVLVFSLILSGCGGQPAGQNTAGPESTQPAQGTTTGQAQNGQPAGDTGGNEAAGDRLAKAYTDMMQGGRYFMKYRTTMEMDGTKAEAQIEMAMDGDMTAMKTVLPGVESYMVKKDNKIFMIDHNTKTVMVMTAAAASDMEDPGQYSDGLSYLGSGTGDFLGKNLPYEEYAVETGTIKYFFDGKALAGMIFHSQAGDQVMEILEISDQIPADLFVIPDGYTQTTIGG